MQYDFDMETYEEVLARMSEGKKRKNWAAFWEKISEGAADDSVEDQYILAAYLQEGYKNVEADPDRAESLYRDSLNGGFAQAGYNLGWLLYWRSKGDPLAFDEARDVLAAASEMGCVDACIFAGDLHLVGTFSPWPVDLVAARRYYRLGVSFADLGEYSQLQAMIAEDRLSNMWTLAFSRFFRGEMRR